MIGELEASLDAAEPRATSGGLEGGPGDGVRPAEPREPRERKGERGAAAADRALADAMPQIVWVSDPEGRLAYLNRRWGEYTGQSAEAWLDWSSPVHPDDRPGVQLLWARALAAGERCEMILAALSHELRSLGVTTLITSETSKPYGPEVAMRIEGASALVDNLLLLEYLPVGTHLRRLLSVVKQRGGWHETSMHEFARTSSRLVLSPDASSAEELFTGGGDGALGHRNHKSRPAESG